MPDGTIVVVSPHSDDGVLSLGAAMSRWVRAGRRVEHLTVLALDPESVAPTGGWDRRAGFATEGEAARARRSEDHAACAVLGVTARWLPFGSVDYERHGDETDVRRAVADAVTGADLVLLPGFPLSHPDHEWLVRTLVSDFKSDTGLGAGRIGLYSEQPYAHRAGVQPHSPPWLSEVVGSAPFEPGRAHLRDRVTKWRAIRRYGSQLPLLGMHRSLRRGSLSYALAPEWVARARD